MGAPGLAERPFLALLAEPLAPEFSSWTELGAEAGTSYLLYYDELTGLPNHRWWARNLGAEVERARAEGTPLAVLWVGIDSSRALEEEYGPRQGDHVLACAASRLREVVGDYGTAARLDGDEFAVLLPRFDREAARQVAEELRTRLEAGKVRLLDSALEVELSASLGLACSPEDVPDPGEAASRAERAGRRAKREGSHGLEVAGPGEAPDRPRRFPCPRLVGRDPLVQGLREALPERPLLVLRGPSGSGRTRVAGEVEARGQNLAGTARPTHADQPFGCLAEALEARPHLLRTLTAGLNPAELGRVASVLPSLASTETQPGDPAPVLARMLASLSQGTPALLKLDDADWCDRGTLRVLELLLQEEWAPAVLLVLGNEEPAHPETMGRLLLTAREGGLLQEFELPPLPPDEVAAMVAEILPGARPAPELVELVARRSGGSPLLVQECLQLLLEADRLAERDGLLGLRSGAREDAEPLLQARTRALPAQVRELLSKAAALGREFGLPEVTGLLGQDEGRVRGALEEAVRAAMLEPAGTPDRYRFTSAGMQDELYGSLAPQARMELHDALARDARGAEQAWHLRRAGREGEADRLREDLEKPFLGAEIPEGEGLSPEDLPTVGHLLYQFRRLLQSNRMYGPEHPEVREAQEAVLALVEELLRRLPHLELAETQGVLRANGVPLGPRSATVSLLEPVGLRSITFLRGVALTELQAFSRGVARKAGGPLDRYLRDHGVSHLIPNEDRYVPAPREGDRRFLVQELQDLGASLESREIGPEDLARMQNLRQELAAWYNELSRYVNLEFLDALSQDWDVLCGDLGSEDRVKVAAASKAFLSHGEVARYRLVQLLARSTDERARKVAAELLARSGEEAVGDLVAAVHQGSVDEERCRLVAGLGSIPATEVDGHLLALVSHPVRAVRRASLQALAGRSAQGLEAELSRLLGRGQPAELRVDAAEGAALCHVSGLVPRLSRLVARCSILWPEDDTTVQVAACRALGALGGIDVIPTLLQALERPWPWDPHWTKPPEVRAAAALALTDLPEFGRWEKRVPRALARASRSRSRVLRSAAKVAGERVQRRASP